MRRHRPLCLLALTLFAACGGGDSYRKLRLELPYYSPFHLEQFEQAVFSGFLIGKDTAGLDLNKEISEYFGPELESRLPLRVIDQPIALESEEIFRKPDFWRSLTPGFTRVLYITGKAEMTREARKTVVSKAKDEIDDPLARQKGFAERTVFSLSLHLFLIRGDSGEVIVDRDFKETRTYDNPKQRADFAFYDLAQRIKSKLFRPISNEERLAERYLLLK